MARANGLGHRRARIMFALFFGLRSYGPLDGVFRTEFREIAVSWSGASRIRPG